MLNREMIVKAFNKATGKRVRVNDPDVVTAFADYPFEEPPITEEMIMACIEHRLVTSKKELTTAAVIREYARWIDDTPEVVDVEPEEVTPVEEPTPEPPKVDKDNPFGVVENMITGLVGQTAEPVVRQVVRAELDAWYEEHAKDIQKISKNVEWTCEERGGKVEGITHKKFDDVCKIIGRNEPVLLVGPAGTGKNFLAKQVADRFNLPFYFTNSVTMEHKLIGFIDANGNYHGTQFFKAFTEGGLFFFDEIDLGDPEILKTFNTAIENGYMAFPTGMVKAHPDFRVIAAANTWGTGANMEYAGHPLDASTRDRFMPEEIDYDPNVEESLTDDYGLLEFIRTFREACDEYGVRCVTSYRAIRRCDKFKDALGIKEALKTSLLKNLEGDDVNMIIDKFKGTANEWAKAFCEIAATC